MASAVSSPTRRDPVASLCRLVLDLRLIAILLTVLWLPGGSGAGVAVLGAVMVVAAVVALAPILAWKRVAPLLLSHPSLLVADLVLVLGILAVAGPVSPAVYVALSSALLAGILYRWTGAVLFAALIVGAHLWTVVLHAPVTGITLGFHSLGIPVLYPIGAGAGAAVRGLLERQLATEAALAERSRLVVVADERARVARELHDSLIKTLHGLSLSAAALAGWVERAPEQAAVRAQGLSRAAEQAASEARELVGDLRADRLDGPLAEAVRAHAAAWSEQSGVAVVTEACEAPALSTGDRYEVLCILRETLCNVERHAGAAAVRVVLGSGDGELRLTVTDDGRGLPESAATASEVGDLQRLAAGGHFGLLGMIERAERIGGRLTVEAAAGGGTRVQLTVPAAEPAAPPEPALQQIPAPRRARRARRRPERS
ncbi:MAG: hypothetical protein GEU81_01670 [Nitriliruptorales bacterium]|nr:hypothetical protein [Nitriliruptorales bacterium]